MMLFTVVVPLYNKADVIVRTVESVLSQTYSNIEVVIVDDGSTDGSVAALENIQDDRMRIYAQDNGGVSVARNFGISVSKGEYICFLDADDVLNVCFLDFCRREILSRKSCVDLLCCNYERSRKGVNSTAIKNSTIEKFVMHDGLVTNFFSFAGDMVASFPCCMGSFVVRREFINSEQIRFPVGVNHTEDLVFVSSVVLNSNRVYFFNKISMIYFIDSANNSKSTRATSGRYIITFLKDIVERGVLDETTRFSVRKFLCKNIINLMVLCVERGARQDFNRHNSSQYLRYKYCSGYYKFVMAVIRLVPFDLLGIVLRLRSGAKL